MKDIRMYVDELCMYRHNILGIFSGNMETFLMYPTSREGPLSRHVSTHETWFNESLTKIKLRGVAI